MSINRYTHKWQNDSVCVLWNSVGPIFYKKVDVKFLAPPSSYKWCMRFVFEWLKSVLLLNIVYEKCDLFNVRHLIPRTHTNSPRWWFHWIRHRMQLSVYKLNFVVLWDLDRVKIYHYYNLLLWTWQLFSY